MNIYVSNLAFSIQNEELQTLFSAYGKVASAKVVMDRETGRSRGFGFVEMEDEAAGREAISSLDQSTQDGRTIRVSVANPKPVKSFSNSPFKSDSGFSRRKW